MLSRFFSKLWLCLDVLIGWFSNQSRSKNCALQVTHTDFKKAKEKVMFKKKEGVPEGLYMWWYHITWEVHSSCAFVFLDCLLEVKVRLFLLRIEIQGSLPVYEEVLIKLYMGNTLNLFCDLQFYLLKPRKIQGTRPFEWQQLLWLVNATPKRACFLGYLLNEPLGFWQTFKWPFTGVKTGIFVMNPDGWWMCFGSVRFWKLLVDWYIYIL